MAPSRLGYSRSWDTFRFQLFGRFLRPLVNLPDGNSHQGGQILVPLLTPLRKQPQDRLLVVAERHRREAY
ncbi:MAG: hypothetical protein ACTHO8_12630 [Solirubrobacterales bacterium]